MSAISGELERLADQIMGNIIRHVREMIAAESKRVFGPAFLGGKLRWSSVLAPTIITVTADATLSAADANTDDWIIVDATSGDITLTFPPVSARARPYLIIKKDGTNSVTFAPDPTLGTDTFNGAASFVLSDQYAWAVVKPDTDNGVWYVEAPPAGGSLELTDGTHDLTAITKITVSGATVSGTSPNATLTVSGGGGGGGSYVFPATVHSADFAMADSDVGCLVDVSGGTVTINLPDATVSTALISVKCAVAGDGTTQAMIAAPKSGSGQNIDGGPNVSITPPYPQNIMFMTDGTNWHVVAAY